MWLYVLHIFCTWLHIYDMHACLICILYIRWMGSFILGFVASLIVISKKTDKINRYLLGRAVSVSSGVSNPSNYRRKFTSQTSDNMDRWKAEQGRGKRRERLEERRSEKRKSQKKEDADARKGRKVAKHCVFPMIWGSGGSKSRLAKAAGAEPAGQMRDEKVHAVVARSTFASQNVQNTPASEHFWKLRCRKSARRCVAKYISKSNCTRHLSPGPLLEVEMSKKCTPLWREAHLQVKMYKTHQRRSTFGSWDVEKVHAVVARSTFWSQNVKNTRGSDHFWTLRCRFAWQAQGIVHLVKSEQTVRVLWHVQKRWQAWDIWRGSAKMHLSWQAQYKRHVHERC